MYTLTKKEIDHFNNNGYIIIKDLVKDCYINDLFKDINIKLDQLEKLLFENKKINKLYNDTTTTITQNNNNEIDKRIIYLDSQFKGTSIMLHTLFASHLSRSFGNLFSNEILLNIIEQLLGTSEISGHPEWNLRVKTPHHKSFEVPWHQDAAYLAEGAERLDQITCWIAMVDIDEKNGALQLLNHSNDSLNDKTIYKHSLQRLNGGDLKDSWYLEILEKDLPQTVDMKSRYIDTVGLKKGSVVLFKNTTCHQSLPNTSDKVRWTVDLRFQKTCDPSGFYPLDQSQNETKMKLRSNDQESIPIDYSKWDGDSDILMKKEQSTSDSFNYDISGPWFDRWLEK